jgi:hypothetical protein
MDPFAKIISTILYVVCGAALAVGLVVSSATVRAYRNRQIPRSRLAGVLIFTIACFLIPVFLLLLLYPRSQ